MQPSARLLGEYALDTDATGGCYTLLRCTRAKIPDVVKNVKVMLEKLVDPDKTPRDDGPAKPAKKPVKDDIDDADSGDGGPDGGGGGFPGFGGPAPEVSVAARIVVAGAMLALYMATGLPKKRGHLLGIFRICT